MSLPAPATTEQIETTRAWVRNFYNDINSSDLNNWLTKYFKTDAILNVANFPSYKGHKEIFENFEKERTIYSNIKHDIKHVDVFSDRIYVQKKVTFIIKNDCEQKEIILKELAVIWKKVDEDKLSSIDVYMDPNPLKERIKMYSN